MSYVFHVWNPAVVNTKAPKNLEDVWTILHAQAELPYSIGAKFSNLAQELLKINERILETENVEEGFYYGDLAHEVKLLEHGVWTIGVNHSQMRALRDLVDVANSLDLCVFDGQVGLYFDPKAGLIPKEMHVFWNEVSEKLENGTDEGGGEQKVPDWKLIKKTLLSSVSRKLEKVGFGKPEISDGSTYVFKRPNALGLESILFSLNALKDDFNGGVVGFWPNACLVVRLSAVEKLLRAAQYLRASNSAMAVFTDMRDFQNKKQLKPIATILDVSPWLQDFEGIIGRILCMTNSLRAIEWLNNTQEGRQIGFAGKKEQALELHSVRRCFLAWQVGNPQFEVILTDEMDQFSDRDEEINRKCLTELNRLVAHIKEYVPRMDWTEFLPNVGTAV